MGDATRRGLRAWMRRTLVECDRADRGLGAEVVHDLRVALRRCRSMADAAEQVDPDPNWRAIRRIAKPLFRKLGDLRDVQVVADWALRLSPPEDPVRVALLAEFLARGERLQVDSRAALGRFDRKRWKGLARKLPPRLGRLEDDGPIFETLAVDRWTEAHDLHRQALKRRSRVAWHRLRIGVKRFRYLVENFLPTRYRSWEAELMGLQDLLGEAHDLDLLWGELLRLRPRPAPDERERWREIIHRERDRRLAEYRARATGADSVWKKWRAGLPEGERLAAASLERLAAWGRYLDPDPGRARNVRRLALDLAFGLRRLRIGAALQDPAAVRLLEAGALLQSVGRSQKNRRYHKSSYALVRELAPPPGWTSGEMGIVALLVRYHRRAEPDPRHAEFRELSDAGRKTVAELAAVLRLANALCPESEAGVVRLDLESRGEILQILVRGHDGTMEDAPGVAAARNFLERVSGRLFAVGPRIDGPYVRIRRRSPAG